MGCCSSVAAGPDDGPPLWRGGTGELPPQSFPTIKKSLRSFLTPFDQQREDETKWHPHYIVMDVGIRTAWGAVPQLGANVQAMKLAVVVGQNIPQGKGIAVGDAAGGWIEGFPLDHLIAVRVNEYKGYDNPSNARMSLQTLTLDFGDKRPEGPMVFYVQPNPGAEYYKRDIVEAQNMKGVTVEEQKEAKRRAAEAAKRAQEERLNASGGGSGGSGGGKGQITCRDCNGSGLTNCRECKGTGWNPRSKQKCVGCKSRGYGKARYPIGKTYCGKCGGKGKRA